MTGTKAVSGTDVVPSIEVVSPGLLTTIQDLGRPCWAHIGVPRSGAADRPALRHANRLVGNADGAPALESTLIGPRLRFSSPTVIALTGATVNATVAGRPAPMGRALTLEHDEVLDVGTASVGLRTYIAFRGGIAAPQVLGSAATDLLTGLGPPRLQQGQRLGHSDWGGLASGAPAPIPPLTAEIPEIPTLHIILGPRDDWFDAASVQRLLSCQFTVSQHSNRVGLRLDGPTIDRARNEELPSEGLVPGAIQVTHDGQPILLLADHPTTGGYPVIAVVLSDDLPLVAQLRVGQQLRFTQVR